MIGFFIMAVVGVAKKLNKSRKTARFFDRVPERGLELNPCRVVNYPEAILKNMTVHDRPPNSAL
jgi:hypothetical protein